MSLLGALYQRLLANALPIRWKYSDGSHSIRSHELGAARFRPYRARSGRQLTTGPLTWVGRFEGNPDQFQNQANEIHYAASFLKLSNQQLLDCRLRRVLVVIQPQCIRRTSSSPPFLQAPINQVCINANNARRINVLNFLLMGMLP